MDFKNPEHFRTSRKDRKDRGRTKQENFRRVKMSSPAKHEGTQQGWATVSSHGFG